jgi:hypothetical protein
MSNEANTARPTYHRCCICRTVQVPGATTRVHESVLGISKETPFSWPTAGISDGLCPDPVCKTRLLSGNF